MGRQITILLPTLILFFAASAINLHARTQELGAAKFDEIRKTAVQFKSFYTHDRIRKTVTDNQTKKVYREDEIITIPEESKQLSLTKQGKKIAFETRMPARKMKALDYYKKLDEYERYYTARGYSLRTAGYVGTIAKYKSNYQKLEIDRRRLSNKFREAAALNLRPRPGFGKGMNISRDTKVEEVWLPITQTREITETMGDPSKMAAWYKNKVSTTKNMDYKNPANAETRLYQSTAVGASLWENEITIVESSAESKLKGGRKQVTGTTQYISSENGTATTTVTVKVLTLSGLVNKYNPSSAPRPQYDTTVKAWKANQANISVFRETFWSKSFRFTAGPIPVTVTLGVRGGVDISWETLLAHELNSTLSMTPHAYAEVFLMGSVGIDGLASVGIGINVRFIDFGFPHRLDLGFEETNIDDNCYRRQAKTEFSIHATITALQGSVFLYFTIVGLYFDVELFSWNGIQLANVAIFSEPPIVYSFCRRPWDLSIRGIKYDLATAQVTLELGNNGGPMTDTERNGTSVSIIRRGNTTPLSIPLITIDPRKSLNSYDGTARLTYSLTDQQRSKLAIPIKGTSDLEASLVLPAPDANNGNDKAQTRFTRNCDIAVTELKKSGNTLALTLKNTGQHGLATGELTPEVMLFFSGACPSAGTALIPAARYNGIVKGWMIIPASSRIFAALKTPGASSTYTLTTAEMSAFCPSSIQTSMILGLLSTPKNHNVGQTGTGPRAWYLYTEDANQSNNCLVFKYVKSVQTTPKVDKNRIK